jgi:cytochrome c oxidase subunit 4
MAHQTTKRPVNYLGIFVLLAAFTLIETLASYLQQAAIKFPVLIVLSLVKAILVLLYFMHLKFDSRIFSYLFITGCVLSIPLILVMMIVMPIIAKY